MTGGRPMRRRSKPTAPPIPCTCTTAPITASTTTPHPATTRPQRSWPGSAHSITSTSTCAADLHPLLLFQKGHRLADRKSVSPDGLDGQPDCRVSRRFVPLPSAFPRAAPPRGPNCKELVAEVGHQSHVVVEVERGAGLPAARVFAIAFEARRSAEAQIRRLKNSGAERTALDGLCWPYW